MTSRLLVILPLLALAACGGGSDGPVVTSAGFAGVGTDGLILTDPDEAFRYMTDIEERDPLYVDEGLVNPGYDAGGDAPGDLPAPSGGGTVDGAEFTFSDDLLMA